VLGVIDEVLNDGSLGGHGREDDLRGGQKPVTTTAYDVPLVDLYRERGLVGRDDPPRGEHLPTRCSRAHACWAGLEARFIPAKGSVASELSAPWIGPAYNVGLTVVVMENLRHYGGFDLHGDTGRGMRHLGTLAWRHLTEGRRRLFATDIYRGTDVWSRALDYAAIWMGAEGLFRPRLGRRFAGLTLTGALQDLAHLVPEL
jgi:hypothetical protein